MSKHINGKGQFQSDKYPDLPPDKIILSFNDKFARMALNVYQLITPDKELGDDIFKRLQDFKDER